MSHALSPDDESDYENTNRNMRLDPDYNCITSNNVFSTTVAIYNQILNWKQLQ